MPARHAHGPSEQELLDVAAACPEFPTLDSLSSADLRNVVATDGLDFATALLYDRLLKSDPGIRTVVRPGQSLLAGPRGKRLPELVALVPGAFYADSSDNGADGRTILEAANRIGIPSAVVPTLSFGSLDANAQIILRWLTQHLRAPTVLVTLSKGGADLKWAMQLPAAADAFRHVIAWINISGITEGTPLVSWLLERSYRSLLVRPLFLWRNYNFDVVRQLGYGPQQPLSCPWSVPSWMSVIHVLAFPLARHLSCGLARRGRRRLADYGPNDGAGIVLHDAVLRPGAIYPVWGADHYLRNNTTDLSQVFYHALKWLDSRECSPD